MIDIRLSWQLSERKPQIKLVFREAHAGPYIITHFTETLSPTKVPQKVFPPTMKNIFFPFHWTFAIRPGAKYDIMPHTALVCFAVCMDGVCCFLCGQFLLTCLGGCESNRFVIYVRLFSKSREMGQQPVISKTRSTWILNDGPTCILPISTSCRQTISSRYLLSVLAGVVSLTVWFVFKARCWTETENTLYPGVNVFFIISCC